MPTPPRNHPCRTACAALAADRTLGGLCDRVEAVSPQDRISLEPVGELAASGPMTLTITRPNGATRRIGANCAIRTARELQSCRLGGILAEQRRRLRASSGEGPGEGSALRAGRAAFQNGNTDA